MIKKAILLLGILLLFSLLSADTMPPAFFNPNMNLTGLLNPNNLRMNHSMSFMSGFSSTGTGFYQSKYTNHLHYSFHPKLDLNVDLNFINFGTASWDNSFSVQSNKDNASAIVPEFSLKYRPTDNSRITIEFRQLSPARRNDYWW